MNITRYTTITAIAVLALVFTTNSADAQFEGGGNSSGRPAFAHYPSLAPVVRNRPVGDRAPGIFMTSINFPGVYGAHTIGVVAAGVDVSPRFSWQSSSPRPTLARRTVDDVPMGYLPATIRVLVPGNAELFFQDEKVPGSGYVRELGVPPMAADQPARFEVRARWKENGQTVSRREMVRVLGGETVVVDLGGSDSSYSSAGETNELRTGPIPSALRKP